MSKKTKWRMFAACRAGECHDCCDELYSRETHGRDSIETHEVLLHECCGCDCHRSDGEDVLDVDTPASAALAERAHRIYPVGRVERCGYCGGPLAVGACSIERCVGSAGTVRP